MQRLPREPDRRRQAHALRLHPRARHPARRRRPAGPEGREGLQRRDRRSLPVDRRRSPGP